MTMVSISDHAVLRYLERAYGVDMAAVRAEMNVPGLAVAVAFGADTVKLGSGVRLKLQGGVVATVHLPSRFKRK